MKGESKKNSQRKIHLQISYKAFHRYLVNFHGKKEWPQSADTRELQLTTVQH